MLLKKVLAFHVILSILSLSAMAQPSKQNILDSLSAIHPYPHKSINDTAFKLGDIIKIPAIEYNLNNTTLSSPDATHDSLDLVFNFLQKYDSLVVEVGVHTDIRGSDKYNLRLSEARAKSCQEYLVDKKGIKPERVKVKGYGEAKPIYPKETVYKHKGNKELYELLHQHNRRTELKVVNFIFR